MLSDKLILTSLKVIWNTARSQPYDNVIEIFQDLKDVNLAKVAVLSNGKKPSWFDDNFGDVAKFHRITSRQSGSFIKKIISVNPRISLDHFITLGASDEDFLMSCNTQTLLIRADWAVADKHQQKVDGKIKAYGIGFKNPKLLLKAIELLVSKQPWFFHHKVNDNFEIYALANGGSFHQSKNQETFAEELKKYLKSGNNKHHKAFLLHLFSSLANGDVFRSKVNWWGFYPSSKQNENDMQTMGLVSRKARESISRAKIARPSEPFFIRHLPSPKRRSSSGNRLDPESQIKTIHVNPYYRDKLGGKTVAILDDYTTNGMSLSCATTLLLEAGAEKVIGIAMGKFGKQLRYFDIDLSGIDVFQPITKFINNGNREITGTHWREAQIEYLHKFADIFE